MPKISKRSSAERKTAKSGQAGLKADVSLKPAAKKKPRKARVAGKGTKNREKENLTLPPAPDKIKVAVDSPEQTPAFAVSPLAQSAAVAAPDKAPLPSKRRGLIYLAIILLAMFVVLDWDYVRFNIINNLFVGRKHIYQTATSTTTPAVFMGQPNRLQIQSLNIDAPVIYATGTTEQIFEQDLRQGAVHYLGTAQPGQYGNVYIFGHSSDYIWVKSPYKTLFAGLPNISLGDQILLSNSQGQTFTYTVTGTAVVGPNDLQYLQQDYSKKLLTLQTSWPVGTALKRFLVFAEITH